MFGGETIMSLSVIPVGDIITALRATFYMVSISLVIGTVLASILALPLC